MKPGPKPQSTAERRRAGNPGKRPYNEDEPQLPAGLPDCPDVVADDPDARACWFFLLLETQGVGLFAKVDETVLALTCVTKSRWLKAKREVDEHGMIAISEKDTAYQSPYVNLELALGRRLQALLAELGLTPSSRSRVTAVKPSKPTNPAAKFFNPRIAKTG